MSKGGKSEKKKGGAKMDKPPLKSLVENMKAVTDRRQDTKVLHKLEDILFIAIVATIANA